MKITKYTMIISSVVFFILSTLCFFEGLFVEIDAYDFAKIYASFNPAKVFLLTSVIILICIIVLFKQKKQNFNIEKVFAFFVALLFVSFGAAYYTENNGNNASIEKATSYANYESTYELNKRYLPYYIFSADETADYEIYKGHAKKTTMVCVDSEILSLNGNMQYEAEFLKTNNPIIYYKYLFAKTVFDDTSIAVNGIEETFDVDDKEVKAYTEGNNYAVCVADNGKILYMALSNVTDISMNDFVQKSMEQFELMEETVAQGKLLND